MFDFPSFNVFQFTVPLQRLTLSFLTYERSYHISIHDFLAETGQRGACPCNFLGCFNSRLPCGSRLQEVILRPLLLPFQLTAPLREPTQVPHTNGRERSVFQLTAPLREPTSCRNYSRQCTIVSTHGSLAGADYLCTFLYILVHSFQLTAPLREPTSSRSCATISRILFQLTAPLREPTPSDGRSGG